MSIRPGEPGYALMQKLKRAKHAVRELDVALALLCDPMGHRQRGYSDRASTKDGFITTSYDRGTGTWKVPRYTQSLDDAVRLLPEDVYWMIGYGKNSDPEPLGAAVAYKPGNLTEPIGQAEALTVPLALCLLAVELRARLGRAE